MSLADGSGTGFRLDGCRHGAKGESRQDCIQCRQSEGLADDAARRAGFGVFEEVKVWDYDDPGRVTVTAYVDLPGEDPNPWFPEEDDRCGPPPGGKPRMTREQRDALALACCSIPEAEALREAFAAAKAAGAAISFDAGMVVVEALGRTGRGETLPMAVRAALGGAAPAAPSPRHVFENEHGAALLARYARGVLRVRMREVAESIWGTSAVEDRAHLLWENVGRDGHGPMRIEDRAELSRLFRDAGGWIAGEDEFVPGEEWRRMHAEWASSP